MRVRNLLLGAAVVCLPAAGSAQSAGAAPAIRFGGYIQADYRAPLGGRDEEDQGFYLRRVRLLMSGTLVEKVGWTVTLEGTNSSFLRDAYISLEHVPAATVRIGQFVMPHGLEQSVFSSNTLEFTERLLTPLVSSRDAGIMVSNEHPFGGWLRYAAAIANGTGMNARDNNDAKDMMLRLTAAPPPVPGLQVSVGGVRGDQPDGMRTRRGADVTFERRSYHLAAEFESERLGDGRKRDGYYLLGSLRLYPKATRPAFHHLEFGSRVGRITGGQPSGQWELAANYYVQQNVRVMCGYIVNSNPAPGAAKQSLHARANIRF